MASQQDDMDNILEMRGPEADSSPVETVEDTVFASLFSAPTTQPHEPLEYFKRHYSNSSSEGEDARAWKKERKNLEASRRASFHDEEAHQMRPRELAVGASSSRVEVVQRSIIEGEDIVVAIIEGVRTECAGSRKPDPPIY